MPFSGILRRVALVRIGISEERITSIIRVTRIGELGATLAVTSNEARCKETTFLRSVFLLLFIAVYYLFTFIHVLVSVIPELALCLKPEGRGFDSL
jgi:hypothetical protein